MANDKDFKAKNRVTALAFHEKVTALTSSAGAMTADLSTASVFTSTLTEDTEVTLSNPPASGSVGYATFVVKADSGTHKIFFSNTVIYETYPVEEIDTDPTVITVRASDNDDYYHVAFAIRSAS